MNWLDLLEFFCFLLFFLSEDYEQDLALENKDIEANKNFGHFIYSYSTELKFFMLCMAFNKFVYFIRIYSKLGLIMRMIYTCTIELIPFVIWFILFLLFFSFVFVILNMQCDGEVSEALFIG